METYKTLEQLAKTQYVGKIGNTRVYFADSGALYRGNVDDNKYYRVPVREPEPRCYELTL